MATVFTSEGRAVGTVYQSKLTDPAKRWVVYAGRFHLPHWAATAVEARAFALGVWAREEAERWARSDA